MQTFGPFQNQAMLLDAARQLSQKMSQSVMNAVMGMAKAQEQMTKELAQAQSDIMNAFSQFCAQTAGSESQKAADTPMDAVKNFYDMAFRHWAAAVPQWMSSGMSSNPMEKAWRDYYADKMGSQPPSS